MPKMKTKSSAKKRFKKTANGKIKFAGAFRRHLMTKKKKKTKRGLKRAHYISAVDHGNVSKLLPY